MNLSPHFTLEEFTKSQIGIRTGIDNTPTEAHIINMKRLCAEVLEVVRANLGPVHINSGYRGQALNKATKGMSGKAAKASLTVQFYDIAKSFVPATMTMGGLGYGSPAMIADGTNRVGPIRRGMNGRIGAYTAGSPLLNAYTQPGRTALLSGARQRETQRY